MSATPIIPGVIRREIVRTEQDAARWMRDAAGLIGKPALDARITVGNESGNSRLFSIQVVNRDGVECQGIYAVLFWISDTVDGSHRGSASSGGGGGNGALVTIDFGTGPGKTSASTVVTGQTWVTATSSIAVTAIGTRAEDAAIEEMTFTVGDLVDGVGFTVYASSPYGSVGSYVVACVGV